MGKPKAPPAPDYTGAAAAQGAANKEAAIVGAQLGNPNVTNPYGSQTVSYRTDPTTGNPVPVVNQQFAPEQQKIFETEQALQQKLGMLGLGAADLAGNTVNQPLDFNATLGTQAHGRQGVIDAMMSRYDTDLGQRREQINSDLIARGIPPGSKAYEVEMDRLSRGRNDALQQATIASDSKAMDERRQAITELLAQRQVPLNEISAFRSGSQIAPLQFSNVAGQNVGSAPIFGATQAAGQAAMDQYGIKTGTYNNMLSGLFGLGAGAAFAASDRRLKSNIVRIGTHPLGIGVYEYDIFGRREVGVMAQELLGVMPWAVRRHPSGYLMVDYGSL